MSTHNYEGHEGHEHHLHTPPHDNTHPHAGPETRRRHNEDASPMRVTADPYPFIYSKDLLDRRRYSLFGGAPTGRVSRGAAIFSIAIIVAVLGMGLATILLDLFGK